MIALHILTKIPAIAKAIVMAERGALGELIVRKWFSRTAAPSYDLDQTWSHEPSSKT